MPQDAQHVPVEASEVLVFTPKSIAHIEGAPSFTLRAGTLREERFLEMLKTEDGLISHDTKQLRAEIRRGLAAMWTEAEFAENFPRIETYWESLDEFILVRRSDETAQWDFDIAEIVAVDDLLRDVGLAHAPLARMKAQNEDARIYGSLYLAAVIVSGWTGIDVTRTTKRGYTHVDCMSKVSNKLYKFEETHRAAHDLKPGTAWGELIAECDRRISLDEEEAKNSDAPSPSSESPAPSTETSTSVKAGKSRASASSSKTPATA